MTKWLKDQIGGEDLLNKSIPVQQAIEKVIHRILDVSDTLTLQKIVFSKSMYKHTYILLDTALANDSLSKGSNIGWNFSNNEILQSGTINAAYKSKNLIGMKIFPIKTDLISHPSHTFSVSPFPYTVVQNGIGPIYKNDFVNLNNAFTILIEEFSTQANIGKDGRKFHFNLFPILMNPATSNEQDTAWTPTNPYFEFVTRGRGDGWFWFDKPITHFSTLTISMANPFKTILLSDQTRTLIPLEFIFLSDD